MNNNKNILVTGGAGYIGSHVCKALKNAGFNPISYDNLSNGHRELVKWGPLEVGDITDKKHMGEVCDKYSPIAAVHMAAFIAAGESVEQPGKYYHNNTYGGLCFIEAMLANNVSNIVFSSTAAVYGIPDGELIDETLTTKPINPYGYSKLAVERFLADFAVSDDLSYVSLRYFNAAGADPESQTGCLHNSPNNLIPIIMEVQSGKRDRLEIFGTDYDTPDGTAIRDYIHVSDLADAHVKSIKYLLDNKENLTVNLGVGRGISVSEVITSAEKITGKPVPKTNSDRRAGDPPVLVANSEKAYKTLKWQPQFTNIDDIVSSAWKWQLTR